MEAGKELRIIVPEKLYRALEKLALIRNTTINSIVIELIQSTVTLLSEIDSYYKLKYEVVVEELYDMINKSIADGKIRVVKKDRENLLRKYIRPFAMLVTVIRDVYGRIPNEVKLSELVASEKVRESLAKYYYKKSMNPEKILYNKINEVKKILELFKVNVVSDGNEIVLKIENPAFLERYYGLGSRIMRRKLK
ncbi:MAG: hypothetical protein QXV69_07360 [Sulfolobaceae archaeon]